MNSLVDPVLKRYSERFLHRAARSSTAAAAFSSFSSTSTMQQQLPAETGGVTSAGPDRFMAQSRIDAHFLAYQDDNRFARIASTRLRDAVGQIAGKRTSLKLMGPSSCNRGSGGDRGGGRASTGSSDARKKTKRNSMGSQKGCNKPKQSGSETQLDSGRDSGPDKSGEVLPRNQRSQGEKDGSVQAGDIEQSGGKGGGKRSGRGGRGGRGKGVAF